MYQKPPSGLKPVINQVSLNALGLIRPVSSELALKIKGIADWDLSFLRHRDSFHNVSDADFDRGLYELKRYHAIGIIDVTYVHAVSAAVDPFWHEQIHFSVDYQAFCRRFVGHYKDHFPIDETTDDARNQIMPCYERTLEVYTEYFGIPDMKWWPDRSPVCLDVNHFMGEYKNGWYEPLDWNVILSSTKSYDEIYAEIMKH